MAIKQPTTARELLSSMRHAEYKMHTQDPNKGADFDDFLAHDWKPIKEQLELACMQAMKDGFAVERIDLSYSAMDRLLVTDPLHIKHIAFGHIEWQDNRINPAGEDVFGKQYRLVTRPLKPSEAGHTIRGKLP